MADKQIHVALAGNPNCGKTTLFNLITGSNGFVGNWPGATVEKKQAELKSDKNVIITDLPGIYSLSPYSPEEVVSRDYLMGGEPDVVIMMLDASNLERNLYLGLQVIETGLPCVVALNMCDVVEKNGDKIDAAALSKALDREVYMISALKNTGVDEMVQAAIRVAGTKGKAPTFKFDSSIEDVLDEIEGLLPSSVSENKRRYYAVKVFERDEDATKLIHLTKDNASRVEELIKQAEEQCDDDAESIITSERYALIAHIVDDCLKKAPAQLTISEKIDKVVTNRILGLPIFILIMFLVYYVSVSTVGSWATDWANDGVFGEGWSFFGIWVPGVPEIVGGWLEAGGADPDGMVYSLVIDGIIGGLGAILGFVPQMFILFVFLVFLEDCGYMARVAFIMDRVFRRFGLSGKSFIPMLVSSGCGVPGVMATKTIENENDRRMTVMTTTFIPCGAKLPIIALLMGCIIGDSSTTAAWISPLFYFLGVAAVICSGIMLKKTKLFRGKPTPFVMELVPYHMPSLRSWALHVWERCWAFIKKAGTVIFASTVVVWFLTDFGVYDGSFGFLPAMEGIPEEFTDYSVLAMLGRLVAWIFVPLGFGYDAEGAWNWEAAAMTVSGLVAKENVVATAGSILHVADATETDPTLWAAFRDMFPTLGGCIAFGAFNLLCAPCFAAMGTIANQMNSGKWTAIAIGYECGFAWVVALIINAAWNAVNGIFNIWSVLAAVCLALMLFQLFRPMPKDAWDEEDDKATAAAAA